MSNYSDSDELVLSEDVLQVLDGLLDRPLDAPPAPQTELNFASKSYYTEYKQKKNYSKSPRHRWNYAL
jgi:hypothetical protein